MPTLCSRCTSTLGGREGQAGSIMAMYSVSDVRQLCGPPSDRSVLSPLHECGRRRASSRWLAGGSFGMTADHPAVPRGLGYGGPSVQRSSFDPASAGERCDQRDVLRVPLPRGKSAGRLQHGVAEMGCVGRPRLWLVGAIHGLSRRIPDGRPHPHEWSIALQAEAVGDDGSGWERSQGHCGDSGQASLACALVATLLASREPE